jgi:sugar O-acyltransferase (sialic acid O-acetyltransferase NeuD family)
MPEVVVLGAGGHARVVVATLRAAGHHVAGIFDDDVATWGSMLFGVRIGADLKAAAATGLPGVIAIGDNARRAAVAAQLNMTWASAIHPRAHVEDDVVIGPGTVVFAGAVIQPGTVLGAHVIANTGCSIDHDCKVADFAHIAPGARLGGGVTIGTGTLIGIGSCVLPCQHVGEQCTVGGGAAVVAAVPDHSTVAGVPARMVIPLNSPPIRSS